MMEKKMKKTERRMSTRIVPDSVEPAVIRYSPCSTEPLLPAVFLMQPANNRVPEEAKDEDNVLLDVARLVDKKIIEAEQREAERNSRSSHSKAAIASSLALLASVLLIVAVLIWHEAPPERGPDPMCETSDCLRFAFIIGQSMDRSADACAAFGTFVCGGARLPDMHSWMPEARDNLLHSWTNDVIESLNAPKVGDSAGRILDNARAMLQSCLETACDETISQRNARDLRIFLEQRKLSWPGDPQRSDVHPLDVLLDLAINWQMPLWFNVGILTTSVTVLLADRRLLTTTDHFFAKFFWEELLDHMSRSVVNAFANVIYSATPSSVDNAGTALNDSVPCPTVAIRTRCELQAEYTYRLFLAVNHGEHVGMAARRKHLLVILNEALRAAVAALIRRKNMASEQRHGSTDAAINRLQRIRLDVWPSDELLRISRDELELMYSSFPEPDAAHSYLEHLLATRRALRSLLGSPTYRHLTGIGAQGGRSRDGFFGYDPFENAVFVWPGVLREPLFYARATKAVNYGGVGAAFARQLTAAMDVDEVFFDAENSTWSVHRRDRAKGDLNAEQRALGIAHDAYVENVEFDEGGAGAQHVVSLEEFSAEQIFFISYCHSLCQLLPFRGHQRCTNAVKGFDYFEEAFHCKASNL
ncbi:uncharacterized protein [Dermacentor albipictus]|uniref:uncharacterized protein isoform X3 n=1 Tax=Dermacentor albipictus TaxID=60249 RepID=UPI0038FC6175